MCYCQDGVKSGRLRRKMKSISKLNNHCNENLEQFTSSTVRLQRQYCSSVKKRKIQGTRLTRQSAFTFHGVCGKIKDLRGFADCSEIGVRPSNRRYRPAVRIVCLLSSTDQCNGPQSDVWISRKNGNP